MKNRKLIPIISVLLIFGQSLIAQETEDYSKAEISIRYENRTIFYPGSDADNPVNVHITVKNNGADTLRFKLADDRKFSLDFDVFTVRNKSLPQTQALKEKRTTNQTVYFREIALETGEEYSFVENLKDYVQIDEASVYYLRARFYPELYKSKYIELVSNRLTLEVKPTPSAAASAYLPVETGTVAVLKPEQLSPDKVVEQTIIARQKSLWDQYFLYMDVESILRRNSALARKYTTVSAAEKERLIESFKADLMQERIENDIIAIPERFQIEKTTYTPTEGTVVVQEWFKYPNFSEKKRYTYKVRQREGIWMIYDYIVVNLGTE